MHAQPVSFCIANAILLILTLDVHLLHISDGGVSIGVRPILHPDKPGHIDHGSLLHFTAVVKNHVCRPSHQGGEELIVIASFLATE